MRLRFPSTTPANTPKPVQKMAGETETSREACFSEDFVQPHSEMPVVASPVVSVMCSGHRDVRITDEEDRERSSELVYIPCCYALIHGEVDNTNRRCLLPKYYELRAAT